MHYWMEYKLNEQEQWLKEHDRAVAKQTGKLPIKKGQTSPKTPLATKVPHNVWFDEYNRRS